MVELITAHLATWATAQIPKKNGGRGPGRGTTNQSPHGIKKLRELILELAVRGKLVPQDPNEEPASVLLEKIAKEKARLIKEGKIKKQKPLPEIRVDEKPFDLPNGWQWDRLGNLCSKLTDGSHNPPSNAGEGFPMLSSQNVNYGRIDFTNPSRYVTAEDFEEENKRTQVEPNDVLLTIVASLGRSAVVPGDAPKFVLQRSVAVLQTGLESNFLALQLVAPLCVNYYEKHAKGTAQKGIYLGKLSLMEIVVPPLAEQYRIVAKVDELMALCDRLEQQQIDSADTHQTLVENLLATLTQSTDQNDFNAAWQRIAANFATLFTTEHSNDQLKQAILQLAVMGKLVPQDPNDEPASTLLEKIAKEKARLVKEGKIKKQKKLPEITEEERPFELPKGWELVRLGNLIPDFQNGASSRGDKEGLETIVLRLADIKNWKVFFEDTRSLRINEKSVKKYSLKTNDVLIIRVNGSADIVGRFILCDQEIDAIYCDHFIRMRFAFQSIAPSYLELLGSSDLIRNRIKDLFVSTAGQKTVNQKHISSLVVTLPPLAEQHRIVAKVDELMALCDTLKERLQEAQTIQVQLADAIVEQAVA